MQYHAPSKQFTVSLDKLQSSADVLRFAIKKVRESAGLPLDSSERSGPMSHACHAEKAILDAAKMLGIDLGATQAGRLDLRDAG